jgi:hypothetical protein
MSEKLNPASLIPFLDETLRVSDGKLGVNPYASITWNGTHIHNQPLILSSDQRVDSKNLVVYAEAPGDILSYDGGHWGRLPGGENGQVLVILNNRPVWMHIGVDHLHYGNIPSQLGGTGHRIYKTGEMLYGNDRGVLSKLEIGMPGEVLSVQNGQPSWTKFPGVFGVGTHRHLAVWKGADEIGFDNLVISHEKKKDMLTFSGINPSVRLASESADAGLSFLDGTALDIGINTPTVGKMDDTKLGVKLRMDIAQKQNLIFQIIKTENGRSESIFSIDKNGVVRHCRIDSESLQGPVKAALGGTGIKSYAVGDILFASSESALSPLKAGSDGTVLMIVDGVPSWMPLQRQTGGKKISGVVLDIEPLTPVPLPGKLERAPGSKLYFSMSDEVRKEFAFTDSNITGSAAGLSKILDLRYGGTGADMTYLKQGQMIACMEAGRLGGLDWGKEGHILISQGPNKIPTWGKYKPDVSAMLDGGIAVDFDGEAYSLSVDTSATFTPKWLGAHAFLSGVVIKNTLALVGTGNKPPMRFMGSTRPDAVAEGDIWYNGHDLMFQTSKGAINITNPSGSAANTTKRLERVTMASGFDVQYNGRRFAKCVVPYLGNSVTRWKLKRVDVLLEEFATTGDVRLNFDKDGYPILGNDIVIKPGTDYGASSQFTTDTFTSGDIIRLSVLERSDSNYWNIQLLFEESGLN